MKEQAISCAWDDPVPRAIQPLACLTAQKSYPKILKVCLEAGAQFNKHLNRAALKGLITLPMLELLHEIDWRSIRSSSEGLQSLVTICTAKPPEVLAAIYKLGARASPGCITTVILTNKSLKTIKVMLEEGHAKENLKGSAALQLAAKKGDVKIVRMILDAGADIDEIPLPGDFREAGPHQALFEAVKAGHVEVVKLLLERGSRPEIDNGKFYLVKNGTALDCARKKGNDKIIQLLEGAHDVSKQ